MLINEHRTHNAGMKGARPDAPPRIILAGNAKPAVPKAIMALPSITKNKINH